LPLVSLVMHTNELNASANLEFTNTSSIAFGTWDALIEEIFLRRSTVYFIEDEEEKKTRLLITISAFYAIQRAIVRPSRLQGAPVYIKKKCIFEYLNSANVAKSIFKQHITDLDKL
ncbi:hypothetical protein ACJX0J_024174, partial [Zea mays]